MVFPVERSTNRARSSETTDGVKIEALTKRKNNEVGLLGRLKNLGDQLHTPFHTRELISTRFLRNEIHATVEED